MTNSTPVSGPGDAGTPAPAGLSNLTLRIASAVVLAPIAVGAAYIGGWSFALFWGVAAIAVLWEWTTLSAGSGHRMMFSAGAGALAVSTLLAWQHRPIAALLLIGLGALAAAIFAPRERLSWVIAGVGYAGVMLLAPMLLRDDGVFGLLAIGFLFAIVWTTDIAAYFVGRTFGGPKLCPAISPKKTWSGAFGGTLGAMAIAVALTQWFGLANWIAIAAVALMLSVLSQAGDLLESWIKRRFGAKDASQLIPGHGGVMDRLDGFWAAALAACVIGVLRGGFEGAARGLLVW